MEISYDEFKKVEMYTGTVLSVKNNQKARKPALVLEIDFGEKIGIKISSAQITHFYNYDNIIGNQIIAVCNFSTKNIAGIISEVLVLGAVDNDNRVTLIHPTHKVENGLRIF